jgi:lipoprotein NlpD
MTTLEINNRSIGRRTLLWSLLVCSAIVLIGCKTHSGRRAPIEERGREMSVPARTAPAASAAVAEPAVAAPKVQNKKIMATQKYVVVKGDTMYSIAFFHGVDYRELAELNKIGSTFEIHIGQQLLVPLPAEATVAEGKSQPAYPATQPGGMKMQPKVAKIPYTENALAQAEAMQGGAQKVAAASAVAATDVEENVEWGMPTNGKIIAEFSESDNRKGVDIAGTRGQAVVASAAGKVVYSGSGLRGYGKLVIIKHNKTFLSAYAHNDQILVKEGQSISKGQKIAEMGDSDSNQIALHFEIRKLGQPVDPAQYLPLIKP